MAQSIVKVLKELIKLQQDVELAIDCFFVNKHIFLTTMNTKICFTTVTHLAYPLAAQALPSRLTQGSGFALAASATRSLSGFAL